MEREKNNYGGSGEAERKIRVVEFAGAENSKSEDTAEIRRHLEDAPGSMIAEVEELF